MDPLDDRAVREQNRRRAPPARRDVAVDDAQADTVQQNAHDGLQEDQHRGLPAVVEEDVACPVADRHDRERREDERVVEIPDADVAVLRGRPPEQREEYAVDQVEQREAGDDLPERRFHNRVENVSVRQPIGHVLSYNSDFAARLREGVEAVHEPVLLVLAAHDLLVLDACRPRAVRVQRAGTAREIVEEPHRR